MSNTRRFREKPKEIEAKLFDGSTDDLMEVVSWIREAGYIWFDMFTPAPAYGVSMHPSTGFLIISDGDSNLKTVRKGEWVIKDIFNNFEPMSSEQIDVAFDPIEGTGVVNPVTPTNPTKSGNS